MPDTKLSLIKRQDGRVYRPRKIVTDGVVDEDEILTWVIVLGTHDTDRAQPLADHYVVWQLGAGYRAKLVGAGWWRDGFESGRRVWVADEARGRAGVWFSIEEGHPDA